MPEIDDETIAYVLESRQHFEDLKQASAQLAGLLVLAAAGAKSASPDHPLLTAAQQILIQVVDGVGAARVTARARRHHAHLRRAVQSIGSALDIARTHLGRPGRVDVDPILVPLRAGYAHLQRAAGALPGFHMVDFEQGCCGRPHVGPAVGALTAPVPTPTVEDRP